MSEPEYYGDPVTTHRFFPGSDNPYGLACAVWKCGRLQEDPVHDHG